PSTVIGFYQPFTMLSLMFDVWISGGTPSPTVFHLTNVLWHALNSVLVLLIVRAACGGFIVPVLAALLFGLHPVQVESVSWISQRKTVLGSAGALTAMLCHMEYGRSGRAGLRWAGLAAFVFAVMSKPTAMLLPIALVLLDIWPLRRFSRRTLIEKWPYVIVMIATMWIAFVSLQETVGVGVPKISGRADLVKLIAYNLTLYARNVVWPIHLTVFYGAPDSYAWTNPVIVLSIIGALIAIIAWLTAWRWSRPVFVGLGA